jgi:Ca-activated chloride channel family protein
MKLPSALSALLALASVCATAQQPPLQVILTSPSPREVVSGEVMVSALVVPADARASVVFWVDSRAVMELTAPPYQTTVDVGQENVAHHFRVVARSADGTTVEDTVETGTIAVNEEIRVNLEQLYVTVTRNGRRVLDLGKDDFSVYDDGRRESIATFARGDIPLTAVVLLDSSLSMEGARLRAAREGASAFFRAMRPLDEGKLLVFSDRTRLATPFTNVPEVLLAGLARLTASGGTALNDNLYLALKWLEERQGRRVVVLLSDGRDSHSVLSMRDVLVKARQSQALIYWIRLAEEQPSTDETQTATFSTWRDGAWYKRERRLLEDTVSESGGRIVEVPRLEEIPPAFAEVLRELREQYVLGYEPTDQRHDGRWRRVEVKLTRSGDDVLTRGGYLDM